MHIEPTDTATLYALSQEFLQMELHGARRRNQGALHVHGVRAGGSILLWRLRFHFPDPLSNISQVFLRKLLDKVWRKPYYVKLVS
jgi:hypothetical protein